MPEPMSFVDRLNAMHHEELTALLAAVARDEHVLVTAPSRMIPELCRIVQRVTDAIVAEPESSDLTAQTQIAALKQATASHKAVVLPYLDVALGLTREADASIDTWLRSPQNRGVPLVALSASRVPPSFERSFDRVIHVRRTPIHLALSASEKLHLAGKHLARVEDLTFGVDASSLTRALLMAWREPRERRVTALETALGADCAALAALAGLQVEVDALRAHRAAALRSGRGLRLLVLGAPGSGKSTIALALAQSLGRVVSLSAAETLAYDGTFAPDNAVARTFESTLDGDAVTLDDIDVTIRRAPEYSGVGGLRAALGNPRFRRVHVIATATHDVGLDPSLRGHFDVVQLRALDRSARAEVLGRALSDRGVSLTDALVGNTAELTDGFADETTGERYGPRRLQRVAARVESLVAGGASVTADAVRAIIDAERRTAYDPVPWDLIGGLHAIKRELEEELIRPSVALRERPELAHRLMVHGLLFNGPTGTGKTFLGRSLGQVLGLPTVAIRASDLLAQFVGQTEEAIRTLFANLRALGGALLFIDEVDSLLPHRGRSVMGYERPIVNAMLSELDGLKSNARGLIVIGATNRKDDIDEAALRPGRLELHLEFAPPSRAEAVDMLERAAEHTGLALDQELCAELVERLWARDGGTTPARLAHLCRRAARRGLWDHAWRPTLGSLLALA